MFHEQEAGAAAAARAFARSRVTGAGARALAIEGEHRAVPPAPHEDVSAARALEELAADLERRTGLTVLATAEGRTAPLAQRVLRSLDGRTAGVLLDDPAASFDEVLAAACAALGLDLERGDAGDPFDRLLAELAQRARNGRGLVLVVDAAHRMGEDLLGELVLLSKWPSLGRHVLHLVLVGGPDTERLVDKLVARDLVAPGYRVLRVGWPEPQSFVLVQAPLPEPAPSPVPLPTPEPATQEAPVSRLENLNKILKNLQTNSPGVEASALISEDGLMIASALSPDLDDTRVGGMSATLLNLGTRAAAELRRGEVNEVIVRGDDGYAVMVSAGRGVLLLILANAASKLGLIFFDLREAIKAINKVL